MFQQSHLSGIATINITGGGSGGGGGTANNGGFGTPFLTLITQTFTFQCY